MLKEKEKVTQSKHSLDTQMTAGLSCFHAKVKVELYSYNFEQRL